MPPWEAAAIEPASRRKQNPKQVALLPANALISQRLIPPLRPVSSRLVPFNTPLEGHTGGTCGPTEAICLDASGLSSPVSQGSREPRGRRTGACALERCGRETYQAHSLQQRLRWTEVEVRLPPRKQPRCAFLECAGSVRTALPPTGHGHGGRGSSARNGRERWPSDPAHRSSLPLIYRAASKGAQPTPRESSKALGSRVAAGSIKRS